MAGQLAGRAGPAGAAAHGRDALLHDQGSGTALHCAHSWWASASPQPQVRTGLWGAHSCLVLMALTGWGQPPEAQSRLRSQGDAPMRQDCSWGLQGLERC